MEWKPGDRAGFVLAGGLSSRMGRDKALLEISGASLIACVAQAVAAAAGNVTLIGDPGKYRELGYPVTPDIFAGCGPLAGIHAALSASESEWNLIVACDMPDVRADFLTWLLFRARGSEADCLLPAADADRLEPLCGVYHRRCLPAVRRALESGVRKVTDGLAGLRVEVLRVKGSAAFRNINTPEDWMEYTRAQTIKTPDGTV